MSDVNMASCIEGLQPSAISFGSSSVMQWEFPSFVDTAAVAGEEAEMSTELVDLQAILDRHEEFLSKSRSAVLGASMEGVSPQGEGYNSIESRGRGETGSISILPTCGPTQRGQADPLQPAEAERREQECGGRDACQDELQAASSSTNWRSHLQKAARRQERLHDVRTCQDLGGNVLDQSNWLGLVLNLESAPSFRGISGNATTLAEFFEELEEIFAGFDIPSQERGNILFRRLLGPARLWAQNLQCTQGADIDYQSLKSALQYWYGEKPKSRLNRMGLAAEQKALRREEDERARWRQGRREARKVEESGLAAARAIPPRQCTASRTAPVSRPLHVPLAEIQYPQPRPPECGFKSTRQIAFAEQSAMPESKVDIDLISFDEEKPISSNRRTSLVLTASEVCEVPKIDLQIGRQGKQFKAVVDFGTGPAFMMPAKLLAEVVSSRERAKMESRIYKPDFQIIQADGLPTRISGAVEIELFYITPGHRRMAIRCPMYICPDMDAKEIGPLIGCSALKTFGFKVLDPYEQTVFGETGTQHTKDTVGTVPKSVCLALFQRMASSSREQGEEAMEEETQGVPQTAEETLRALSAAQSALGGQTMGLIYQADRPDDGGYRSHILTRGGAKKRRQTHITARLGVRNDDALFERPADYGEMLGMDVDADTPTLHEQAATRQKGSDASGGASSAAGPSGERRSVFDRLSVDQKAAFLDLKEKLRKSRATAAASATISDLTSNLGQETLSATALRHVPAVTGPLPTYELFAQGEEEMSRGQRKRLHRKLKREAEETGVVLISSTGGVFDPSIKQPLDPKGNRRYPEEINAVQTMTKVGEVNRVPAKRSRKRKTSKGRAGKADSAATEGGAEGEVEGGAAAAGTSSQVKRQLATATRLRVRYLGVTADEPARLVQYPSPADLSQLNALDAIILMERQTTMIRTHLEELASTGLPEAFPSKMAGLRERRAAGFIDTAFLLMFGRCPLQRFFPKVNYIRPVANRADLIEAIVRLEESKLASGINALGFDCEMLNEGEGSGSKYDRTPMKQGVGARGFASFSRFAQSQFGCVPERIHAVSFAVSISLCTFTGEGVVIDLRGFRKKSKDAPRKAMIPYYAERYTRFKSKSWTGEYEVVEPNVRRQEPANRNIDFGEYLDLPVDLERLLHSTLLIGHAINNDLTALENNYGNKLIRRSEMALVDTQTWAALDHNIGMEAAKITKKQVQRDAVSLSGLTYEMTGKGTVLSDKNLHERLGVDIAEIGKFYVRALAWPESTSEGYKSQLVLEYMLSDAIWPLVCAFGCAMMYDASHNLYLHREGVDALVFMLNARLQTCQDFLQKLVDNPRQEVFRPFGGSLNNDQVAQLRGPMNALAERMVDRHIDHHKKAMPVCFEFGSQYDREIQDVIETMCVMSSGGGERTTCAVGWPYFFIRMFLRGVINEKLVKRAPIELKHTSYLQISAAGLDHLVYGGTKALPHAADPKVVAAMLERTSKTAVELTQMKGQLEQVQQNQQEHAQQCADVSKAGLKALSRVVEMVTTPSAEVDLPAVEYLMRCYQQKTDEFSKMAAKVLQGHWASLHNIDLRISPMEPRHSKAPSAAEPLAPSTSERALALEDLVPVAEKDELYALACALRPKLQFWDEQRTQFRYMRPEDVHVAVAHALQMQFLPLVYSKRGVILGSAEIQELCGLLINSFSCWDKTPTAKLFDYQMEESAEHLLPQAKQKLARGRAFLQQCSEVHKVDYEQLLEECGVFKTLRQFLEEYDRRMSQREGRGSMGWDADLPDFFKYYLPDTDPDVQQSLKKQAAKYPDHFHQDSNGLYMPKPKDDIPEEGLLMSPPRDETRLQQMSRMDAYLNDTLLSEWRPKISNFVTLEIQRAKKKKLTEMKSQGRIPHTQDDINLPEKEVDELTEKGSSKYKEYRQRCHLQPLPLKLVNTALQEGQREGIRRATCGRPMVPVSAWSQSDDTGASRMPHEEFQKRRLEDILGPLMSQEIVVGPVTLWPFEFAVPDCETRYRYLQYLPGLDLEVDAAHQPYIDVLDGCIHSYDNSRKKMDKDRVHTRILDPTAAQVNQWLTYFNTQRVDRFCVIYKAEIEKAKEREEWPVNGEQWKYCFSACRDARPNERLPLPYKGTNICEQQYDIPYQVAINGLQYHFRRKGENERRERCANNLKAQQKAIEVHKKPVRDAQVKYGRALQSQKLISGGLKEEMARAADKGITYWYGEEDRRFIDRSLAKRKKPTTGEKRRRNLHRQELEERTPTWEAVKIQWAAEQERRRVERSNYLENKRRMGREERSAAHRSVRGARAPAAVYPPPSSAALEDISSDEDVIEREEPEGEIIRQYNKVTLQKDGNLSVKVTPNVDEAIRSVFSEQQKRLVAQGAEPRMDDQPYVDAEGNEYDDVLNYELVDSDEDEFDEEPEDISDYHQPVARPSTSQDDRRRRPSDRRGLSVATQLERSVAARASSSTSTAQGETSEVATARDGGDDDDDGLSPVI